MYTTTHRAQVRSGYSRQIGSGSRLRQRLGLTDIVHVANVIHHEKVGEQMRLKSILWALVLAVLATTAAADKVDDTIWDLLYGGSADVRASAAVSLGRIGDPRAVDPLIEALQDEDPEVRKNAAVALGEISDPRAVNPLIEVLDDENPEVWRNVTEALGKLGEQAVDPLIMILIDEGQQSSDARSGAARALGKIGDPRAVEPLIVALKDEAYMVRSGAASALGEISDPRAVDPLIEALSDDEWVVLGSVATALGEIGDPKAVDPLIEALEYEDSARTALLRAFPNRWVRASAANALGDIGDTRAVGPLTVALGDGDEYVRKAAGEALEKIGAE